MIWKSTIIKGKLQAIKEDHHGFPVLQIEEEPFIYSCPTTKSFVTELKLNDRIGQHVIVTAILNADGRLIDTMTLLMEP